MTNNEIISRIARGNKNEEYIIQLAIKLRSKNETMKFSQLIDSLSSNGHRKYYSSRAISKVITEIYNRSENLYEKDNTEYAYASEICEVVAKAYVNRLGKYSYESNK